MSTREGTLDQRKIGMEILICQTSLLNLKLKMVSTCPNIVIASHTKDSADEDAKSDDHIT